MTARIAALPPPYDADIQHRLDAIMPDGVPPLALFTTLARDPRLFHKFISGGLLGKGNVSLRRREIIIDRVSAQCGCEYEWGVHVAFFAEPAGLNEAQIYSLVHGAADDACWSDPADRLLIRLCDELQTNCRVSDGLWRDLSAEFSDPALLEALMLAGNYRTVAYLANATRLPLEDFGARFPAKP